MKKALFPIIFLVVAFLGSATETGHKQLLVFRNTGEVNLFYTDNVNTISIENNDSLGLCQVFTTNGNVSYPIPIAEIDSVAFGSRNITEFKPNVRILTDETDIPHIKAFDGRDITYMPNTPSDITPHSGELLYYGQVSDLFPYGLCGRITSVANDNDGYKASIEYVDPSEIFSQFFYAGDFSDPEVQHIAKRLSRASGFQANLGNISVKTGGFTASIGIDVEFSDVVLNVMRHYYHVKCVVKPKSELEFNYKFDNTSTVDEKYLEHTASLAPIAGVFVPSFDFAAFLKIKASLDFKYHMTRQIALTYEWTRQNGSDSFSNPDIEDINDSSNGKNEAKTYLQLDGSIFAGVELAARFGLIGDIAGAGIRVNVGPRFNANIGIGVLQNLSRQYSRELYATGKISASLGVDFQPFAYYRKFNSLLGGNYETTPLGSGISLDFLKRELNLFPEFEQTVGIKTAETQLVSRTEVCTPVAYPLTIGFDVELDEDSDLLFTKFLDEKLDSDNDEAVGFSQNFDLGVNAYAINDQSVVRPIFKYGDYIIKSASSTISKNAFYNYFAQIANGNSKFVGGAIDVRSKKTDKTSVLIGNYFPCHVPNPLFSYMGGMGIVSGTVELTNSIIGRWKSVDNEEETTFVFDKDGTGSMNGKPFAYELNKPQSGDLKIIFNDESKSTLTYVIINVTSQKLNIKRKGKSAINSFTRI